MLSQVSLRGLAVAVAILSHGCAAQFPPIGGIGGADLETVEDWGENPSDLKMQVYKPSNIAENPAVIFAVRFIVYFLFRR